MFSSNISKTSLDYSHNSSFSNNVDSTTGSLSGKLPSYSIDDALNSGIATVAKVATKKAPAAQPGKTIFLNEI